MCPVTLSSVQTRSPIINAPVYCPTLLPTACVELLPRQRCCTPVQVSWKLVSEALETHLLCWKPAESGVSHTPGGNSFDKRESGHRFVRCVSDALWHSQTRAHADKQLMVWITAVKLWGLEAHHFNHGVMWI